VLAERHGVDVITADWGRPAIEEELQRHPRPGLRVHYVAQTFRRTANWPLGLGWLPYYLWQWRACRLARRLHAEHRFDLVHHVTYATWRSPSFMWKLGIPFVWGPVGGGQNIPRGFHRVLGWRGALRERLREAVQRLARLDPFVRATMNHAAVILAANTATREFLPKRYQAKTRQMLETAIDVEGRAGATIRDEVRPLRILWVGQLVPIKGLPLLLAALAGLKDRLEFRLEVVGAGPERVRWERLAGRLGLAGSVSFPGPLPYAGVQGRYLGADVFVFTSLRDTSGNALLEAMASGLPVICLDWAGPGDITTDECAVRIRPESPEKVVAALREGLERLAADADLRRRLGAAARRRVEREFSWAVRLEAVKQISSGCFPELSTGRSELVVGAMRQVPRTGKP
jgi:glycosyltransferase involved in cell wall biosynthesis